MTPATGRWKAMRLAMGIFFLSMGSLRLMAQSMEETMLEQIVRLEATLQQLKRGYAIVQQGLQTISDIKKGDFDLHNLFFNSLTQVKPAIKQYGKVADIIAMQVQIVLGCNTIMKQHVVSGAFNAGDLNYLAAVYAQLKELTGKDIDELTSLLTDGEWQMSDDQRLAQIDRLYLEVQEKFVFLQSFADRTRQLGQRRNQEKNSLQNLSKLINP